MIPRDEERVIEALRAHTGGLIVTDQDITTAESRLRESLEPPSPRRRLVMVAAAVAAALVVGFFVSRTIDWDQDAAPPVDAPSSPADTLRAALQADAYTLPAEDFSAGTQPTASDLAGFWLLREPYFSPMFVDGGGHWWLGSPTETGVFGDSTLAGETWTRRHSDGSACTEPGGPDFFQSWRATLATEGSLRLELTGGQPNCTPADNREVWDRVAPGSPVGDYLLAMTQEADWQPAPRSFGWRGLYVAPATGHVLEVADGEKYRYYATLTDASLAAADRGEITIDDSETQGSCAGGEFQSTVEVAQLLGVDGYIGSFDAVRLTPSESCASGVSAQEVWVNITR